MKNLRQILGDDLMRQLPPEKDKFPDGFFWWLKNNDHLWKTFEEKAYLMAAVGGRPRYSARTIIEVMRWDTDLCEKEPMFKISNNMVPGLARLWMVKHGQSYPKFFQIREG